MSTIKVDTIQSRQHSASTINLTSTGATVNGDCTATTFSGSGASLTSLPSANLTGAIPANLLTNAGGGALEFVKKIQPTTNIAEITETGLDYDTVYRLVFKYVLFDWSARIAFFPHLDNSTTKFTSTSSFDNCKMRMTNTNGNSYQEINNKWDFDMGAVTYELGGYLEFWTGYRPWIMGAMRPLYDDGFIQFWGRKGRQANTNNDSNQTYTYAKMNGFTIDAWGWNYTTSTEILMYKYKES